MRYWICGRFVRLVWTRLTSSSRKARSLRSQWVAQKLGCRRGCEPGATCRNCKTSSSTIIIKFSSTPLVSLSTQLASPFLLTTIYKLFTSMLHATFQHTTWNPFEPVESSDTSFEASSPKNGTPMHHSFATKSKEAIIEFTPSSRLRLSITLDLYPSLFPYDLPQLGSNDRDV